MGPNIVCLVQTDYLVEVNLVQVDFLQSSVDSYLHLQMDCIDLHLFY